jgi:hypothetical protein
MTTIKDYLESITNLESLIKSDDDVFTKALELEELLPLFNA